MGAGLTRPLSPAIRPASRSERRRDRLSGRMARRTALEPESFWPAAVVVAAALVAYVPAMRGGFVWDDDFYVTANATLRGIRGLLRIMKGPVPCKTLKNSRF